MQNIIVSLSLGGTVGFSFLLADVITGATIGIKDAIAVVVFVAGLVWWLGRELRSLRDKAESMRNDIDTIMVHLNIEKRIKPKHPKDE